MRDFDVVFDETGLGADTAPAKPGKRCCLPNGHSGQHFFIETTDPKPLLGECAAQNGDGLKKMISSLPLWARAYIAEMERKCEEACGHLRLIVLESLPTDDQLNLQHVKDALELITFRSGSLPQLQRNNAITLQATGHRPQATANQDLPPVLLHKNGNLACTDWAALWALRETRIGQVLFSRDGNKICAVRPDFLDLMKSPAGFGETAEEAMAELEREEGIACGDGAARGLEDSTR